MNGMLQHINRWLKDPYYHFGKLWYRLNPDSMPDKWFLSVMWQSMFGYKLDWKNPKTLNEKLQWLKLYDRNPLYTTLVDKYAVKQYIAEKIGPQYVIPTLAVYDSVDEIDLAKLPDRFVLKCTHDSGSVVICHDKSSFDLESAKAKLAKALKHNYYLVAREWPYKHVPHRIIAEEYLEADCPGDNLNGIVDYKFYCYGGNLQYFMYSVGESTHHAKNVKYNFKKENVDFLFKSNQALKTEEICFPYNIDEMISLVNDVAKKIPAQHIRIDLYNIKGHIYLGEFTLYSSGGILNIRNKEYSQSLADLIQIKND